MPTRRHSRHLTTRRRFASAALLALGTTACDWASLAWNALTYDTVGRGAVANLALAESVAYASRAEDGLAIVDARTGATLATLPPPAGSESVDDLAVADGLLFVLDARAPGHLSVLAIADPLHPRLVGAPRPVPVGPFSGVAAAGGLCVVSGGTAALTAWRYDPAGALQGPSDTTDLGRGQPDVALTPDGARLLVATHYLGPRFGLDLVGWDAATGRLGPAARLPLAGAGFTAGGAKPASFPIGIAPLGRDAALVAYRRGVAVIDLAAPSGPVLREHVDVGGPAVSVAVRGSDALVAVAGRRPALVLLDAARTPVRVARRFALAPDTRPLGVALTERAALVAARERGVLVYER
jgi:hypothetical protein